MKPVLILAGVAGLFALSAPACAQSDWTYLVCLADFVEEKPDGSVRSWSETHHYRYDADRAERFDEAAERWADDCVVGGEGYFGADAHIANGEVRCIRAGTNESGGELYYDRSIYLDTGRYTILDYSYVNGASTSRNAEGECRVRPEVPPVKQP